MKNKLQMYSINEALRVTSQRIEEIGGRVHESLKARVVVAAVVRKPEHHPAIGLLRRPNRSLLQARLEPASAGLTGVRALVEHLNVGVDDRVGVPRVDRRWPQPLVASTVGRSRMAVTMGVGGPKQAVEGAEGDDVEDVAGLEQGLGPDDDPGETEDVAARDEVARVLGHDLGREDGMAVDLDIAAGVDELEHRLSLLLLVSLHGAGAGAGAGAGGRVEGINYIIF